MHSLTKEQISNIPLFAGIEYDKLIPALKDCEIKKFNPGQYIYRYGDYGGECGIMLSGQAKIEMSEEIKEHADKEILVNDGMLFGEIAVLSGYIRTADIVTLQPAEVLMIPRKTLFKLFDKFKPIKVEIDRLYCKRVLHSQLLHIPIFAGVSRELLEEIEDKVTLHSFNKGEVVFRQGEDADAFYLIRYGVLKGTEKGSDGRERVLAYLKGGHYFGEMAIMQQGEKRMATISVVSRSELIKISREDFMRIIEAYPRVRASLEKAIERRKERNISIREDEYLERTLSAVIDSGVIQSKTILVIDTTKCIQCDNCIIACAALHRQSRLVKKGTKLNNVLLIATSCRHCDDPVCMIKCPTGAIARDFAGEIYHRVSCIGCGNCARICPYMNISMVTVPETDGEKAGFLARYFKRSKSAGKQSDTGKIKEQKMPVKCDMCRDYRFLGCVYNCPTGAARRIDPTEFFTDIATVG